MSFIFIKNFTCNKWKAEIFHKPFPEIKKTVNISSPLITTSASSQKFYDFFNCPLVFFEYFCDLKFTEYSKHLLFLF